jgi:hypothetical protein
MNAVSPAVIAWKPAAPTPELASARLRCYRPLEYLHGAGWHCELFDRNQMHRYGTVIFQKAYSEEDLDIATHLRSLGKRTVFDLCDNHFYNPTSRNDYRARADRLRRMIGAVDAVTVATPELARLVERPTTIIDDALDSIEPDRWSILRRMLPLGRRPLRLVWFGNAGHDDPPFGLIDVARVRPQLELLHQRRAIELTVISNSRAAFDRYLNGVSFPTHYHDWDNKRYQHILRRQDLCIIPVTPNPFTLCKTVNRLALALLLGLPVVADAIPSYEELRPFAWLDDWRVGLHEYVADIPRQRAQVRAGRAFLRAKYTSQRVVKQWTRVLEQLAA